VLICWDYSYEKRAGATEAPPAVGWEWTVTEIPVVQDAGDQISPKVDGDSVVYNDLNRSPLGMPMVKGLSGGEAEEVSGPGLAAGPDIDAGFIAWQNLNSQACRRALGEHAEQCLALNPSTDFSLSGNKAIACIGNGSSVRLADFSSMSSKYLDSSTTANSRYGSDIDGDTAIWVRERGYAGNYYEPIIYACNLRTNTTSYLTKTGGGVNTEGNSNYVRLHPSISGDRVIYQQKVNDAGHDWDIYQAVPDTFGVAAVEQPGDQTKPSLSGNLAVYQDNRAGYIDADGSWVDDWNIYVKDLDTGIEQPVCAAPGDQVSPAIKGDTVVWQDNRNGDWDVYAAVLSPYGRPRLTLSVGSVYWNSYNAFVNEELTVLFRLNNRGEGPAREVALWQILTSNPAVTPGTTPGPIAILESGQMADMEIRFHCPASVKRFYARLYARCIDANGSEIWFPEPLPAD